MYKKKGELQAAPLRLTRISPPANSPNRPPSFYFFLQLAQRDRHLGLGLFNSVKSLSERVDFACNEPADRCNSKRTNDKPSLHFSPFFLQLKKLGTLRSYAGCRYQAPSL
jgi:hypothetical protein